MLKHLPPSLDIFCRVIDNYGDAGVCGRLAQQWATEIGGITRLYMDDPSVLRLLRLPEPLPFALIPWNDATPYTDPADMVIEAFAANLPDTILQTLAVTATPPVWIDLEYLSAEAWVEGFHAIPSRHPTTHLQKTVFFPGFTSKTGGILREKTLMSDKNAFLSDKIAQNSWRKAHNIPEIDDNGIDISLFCYKTAPEDDFLAALSTYHRPVRVFRPEQREDVTVTTTGFLTLYRIPFLPQMDFDRLCQTSHLNFVRGEDSFVRAQLAGKPFIWNIYVQDDDAHLQKCAAFLERYLPFFAPFERDLLAQAHNLWNEGGRKQPDVWHKLLDSLPALSACAGRWSDELYAQDDLATQLLRFYTAQRQ